jgi:hypothetical protein
MADPMVQEGRVGEPFRLDLRRYAGDIDGDLLSFELLEAPDWATLSALGKVEGTPDEASDATLKVSVSDAQCRASTILTVRVSAD